ncbi:hypothetical protein [Spirosoma flavum]|uniref:Gliding motility-associated C-terminal domain-containing protein n=1 Tax=Spirosoma flavum TaxID=2048557 RepID=A0ABW6AS07_9BACT
MQNTYFSVKYTKKVFSVMLDHGQKSRRYWSQIACLSLLCLLITPVLWAQTGSCPTITNTRMLSVTVCTERVIDSLQVNTTGTIEFVRFDALQTNPYKENGVAYVGEPVLVNGKATLRNVLFPANWGTKDRLYYVYARLKQAPTNPTCLPFAQIIVYIKANPTASVVVKEATCYGTQSQNDGQVSLTGYSPTDTYEMAIKGTFTGQGKAIPADGVIVTNGSRTGIPKLYTVRIYNSSGCYTDRSILMTNAPCNCLPISCMPMTIAKTKSGRQI